MERCFEPYLTPMKKFEPGEKTLTWSMLGGSLERSALYIFIPEITGYFHRLGKFNTAYKVIDVAINIFMSKPYSKMLSDII